MFDVHPDGELAPRDVVARGIAAAMERQGGRPVLLDATALGRATLEHRFPTITRVTAAHGLDWATEPDPGHARRPLLDGRHPHRPRRPHDPARPLRGGRGRVHRRARREPPRVELAARVARVRVARGRRARRAVGADRRAAPVEVAAASAGSARRRRRVRSTAPSCSSSCGSTSGSSARSPASRPPPRTLARLERADGTTVRGRRGPQPARPRAHHRASRDRPRGIARRARPHRLPRDLPAFAHSLEWAAPALAREQVAR